MPRSPLVAGELGGNQRTRRLSLLSREKRCARGKASGRETPWLKESFKKEKRRGVPFLPRPWNPGATRRYTVASRSSRASGLLAVPSTPDALPHSCTHPQPPPSGAPARVPRMSPQHPPERGDHQCRRSSGRGKRGPSTYRRSPHRHGHRGCGSGCARELSANTGCCCGSGSGSPPPRLPRGCAPLAPGSRTRPAASTPPHAAAPPALLEQHGLPPGRDHLLPQKGVRACALGLRRWEGGWWVGLQPRSAGSGRGACAPGMEPPAPKRPSPEPWGGTQAGRWPSPPAPPRAGVRVKA